MSVLQFSEPTALAKRMLGVHATAPQFTELLNACLARVHGHYNDYIHP